MRTVYQFHGVSALILWLARYNMACLFVQYKITQRPTFIFRACTYEHYIWNGRFKPCADIDMQFTTVHFKFDVWQISLGIFNCFLGANIIYGRYLDVRIRYFNIFRLCSYHILAVPRYIGKTGNEIWPPYTLQPESSNSILSPHEVQNDERYQSLNSTFVGRIEMDYLLYSEFTAEF